MAERGRFVILGAGPAGLGAAVRLARRNLGAVTVVERNGAVGGNAGSFEVEGQLVDFGSHRLHPACDRQILGDIRQMLGADLLDRPRHGRIRLKGRWLHFPLKPLDLTMRVPPSFAFGVLRDSMTRSRNGHGDETFASVLERGLGRTICRDFYFPYAEKIWGTAPTELDAVQARRRVSAGSLRGMVRKVLNAVPGLKPRGAGRFFYPRRGYGQISQAYYRAAIDAGVEVRLNTSLTGLEISGGRATAVRVKTGAEETSITGDHILSTIPLPAIVRACRPAPPREVLDAAAALRYRGMVLVYLVLETDRFTEYDAHYFPQRDLVMTRLSEPKNYSLEGPSGLTVLCAELPCAPDDAIWKAGDAELGELVVDALGRAALPVNVPVRRVVTRRIREAYPIYSRDYRIYFDRLDEWVSSIDGLVTFGRQGLFVHDNTHHTLAMGYALEQCIDSGGRFDRAAWARHRQVFESHVVED